MSEYGQYTAFREFALREPPGKVYTNSQKKKQNHFSASQSEDTFELSQNIVKIRLAQRLTEQAENYSRQDNDTKAETLYKDAIKTNPEAVSPYYGLARIYKKSGRVPEAITTYEKLLSYHPDEWEAQTLLGLSHRKQGNLEKAKAIFQDAANKNPKYDFSVRSLKETDNMILAKTDPELAQNLKEQQKEKNLRNALNILVSDTAPNTIDKIGDITFTFAKTDSLSGHQNIAQYENNPRKIVVTNEYVWAAPEIIAAYLSHEAVHGRDKDGFTSIYEEQDAYEESIKFWIKNKNGIEDPELDYAAKLYKQSPETLRSKVAEIYRSRDRDIPEYSPNHKPANAAAGIGIWHSVMQLVSTASTKLSSALGLI